MYNTPGDEKPGQGQAEDIQAGYSTTRMHDLFPAGSLRGFFSFQNMIEFHL